MRLAPFAAAALLTVVACAPQGVANPPPVDAFYFPTALMQRDVAGSQLGHLYVASSNFDKRYDDGTLIAVDLDQVGLPAFGSTGAVASVTDLKLTPGQSVFIDAFAGDIGSYPLPDGRVRLFVPSRAEAHHLQVIDAAGVQLACGFPVEGAPGNCAQGSPSLVAFEEATPEGLPRAPEPMNVAVGQNGQVFVTHLQPADSPPMSREDFHSYVVVTQAENPVVTPESYIDVGLEATHGVRLGERYAYASTRAIPAGGPLLRLIDRTSLRVVRPTLETDVRVLETRELALSTDERRVFVLGQLPSSLLVVAVDGPTSDAPRLRAVRALPLPDGASTIQVLPRPGRGDLVAVVCTSGSVVLYDDDVGEIVARMDGLGQQPFGLTVDSIGAGVRFYVGNFGDGRVAVLDLADLARPSELRLVAYLGQPQTCRVNRNDPSCRQEVSQ